MARSSSAGLSGAKLLTNRRRLVTGMVAGEVGKLAPSVRVAIVRGEHGRFRYADSGIVAAAGQPVRLEIVPLAGHSLKRVILARYIVRSATDWLVSPRR